MAKDNRSSQPGRLRIVAGIWRSRLLQIADVAGLRPTGERIRETLFNWLANDVHGSHCLDLCAGTGALGLEALSRGAASVTFVEKSRHAAQTLRNNIDRLQADAATVVIDDARRFLGQTPPRTFDLVFLDPPFADDLLNELCRLVERGKFVMPASKVYLEMSKSAAGLELPDGWHVSKDKTSGKVRYLLIEVT